MDEWPTKRSKNSNFDDEDFVSNIFLLFIQFNIIFIFKFYSDVIITGCSEC